MIDDLTNLLTTSEAATLLGCSVVTMYRRIARARERNTWTPTQRRLGNSTLYLASEILIFKTSR